MVDGACSCGKGELRGFSITLLFSVIIIHLKLNARAARRLLPRAPGARSSQLNVTKNTYQRPPQAHRSTPTCHGSHQTRRGPPGGVGFCPSSELPPPCPDAPMDSHGVFFRARHLPAPCRGFPHVHAFLSHILGNTFVFGDVGNYRKLCSHTSAGPSPAHCHVASQPRPAAGGFGHRANLLKPRPDLACSRPWGWRVRPWGWRASPPHHHGP